MIDSKKRWAELPELTFDEEGRPLCRWCKKVCRLPRRSWCSDKCVDDYNIRSKHTFARHHVRKRDKGVCAFCGVNTLRYRRRIRNVLIRLTGGGLKWAWKRHPVGSRLLEALVEFGWPDDFDRSWWDADHIKPVVEGGGGCGLDNYRTLCVPCHKRESAKLKGKLASKRQVERAISEAQALKEVGALIPFGESNDETG